MKQLFWFGVVGVTAMLVHLGCVAFILVPAGLDPLAANVLAFLIAFQVSHSGHRRLTFAASSLTAPASQSRLRFFAVAMGSFAINELMYWALLRFTNLDYRLALAIVLILVSAMTFFLARNWAFSERSAT